MSRSRLFASSPGDDNVHYQNSEALINALVQADKQFDMMSYPNRNHAIFGGNTTLHLRQRLTDFIDQTGAATPHAACGCAVDELNNGYGL